MKLDFDRLDVPTHRDGFWDDIRSRLDDEPQDLPLAEVRRFPSWLMAPAAAAAVVVVIAGVGLLVSGPDAVTETTLGPVDSPTTTIAAATTTTVGTEVTPPPSTQADGPGPSWALAPLAQEDVPQVLIDEWLVAANRSWCGALAPVPEATMDGTARAAEFAGGWALAWDRPGQRSAYGVAGTGVIADLELATRWPNVVGFSDGSVLGYGGEGFDPGNPKRLGELVIPSQSCLYQIWTVDGDAHLLGLVESLRFVDGLEGRGFDPVVFETVDGGTAPWEGESALSDVPAFVAQVRNDAGRAGLMLWPTELGLPDDAVLRTATIGSWGVAWDAPGLPGHDGLNYPCAECGRGVVGFSELGFGGGAGQQRPYRIEWTDGSFAEIGLYIGDDQIPGDRPQFVTVDTGEASDGGWQANVHWASTGETYILWSHLGRDHLIDLVESLRIAETA